jgi:hypothetical protein
MINMPVTIVTREEVYLGRKPNILTRLFPMRMPTISPMKATTALTTKSIAMRVQFISGRLENNARDLLYVPQQS